jgi:hypothetical protein
MSLEKQKKLLMKTHKIYKFKRKIAVESVNQKDLQ